MSDTPTAYKAVSVSTWPRLLHAAADPNIECIHVQNVDGGIVADRPCYLRRDGLRVVFEVSALVRAIPSDHWGKKSVGVFNVEGRNIDIHGGTLRMTELDHTLETLHGVQWIGSRYCTITGMLVHSAPGDSFHAFVSDDSERRQNGHVGISSCHSFQADRNGIGILSGNVGILGCTIERTTQKSPRAGVCLEPGSSRDVLSAEIVGNYFDSNTYNLDINLDRQDATSKAVRVTAKGNVWGPSARVNVDVMVAQRVHFSVNKGAPGAVLDLDCPFTMREPA